MPLTFHIKLQIGLLLPSVAICMESALAAQTQDDYHRGLERLQNNQVRIDQALRQFGVSPVGWFSGVDKHSDANESKKTPLFQIHQSLSQIQLPTGKLLFGKAFNRLIVGGEGAPAIIEVDDGQGFASGLRMMGTAKASATPGRIAIELSRLLLRTGRTIPLQAVALDMDGAFGIAAQVLSGKALAVGGAMASSFISGLATSQQTETTNAFGFSQVQPTGRNAILQGGAQTAADQSKHLLQEVTAEKPVLILEALTPVTLLIQEEVRW